MKKTLINLGLCLCLTPAAMAQLPNDYITKVTYTERTSVSFEMVGESEEQILTKVQAGEGYPAMPYGVDCLNLGELSRYHGYRQDINMTQYIDMDGELLTDKVFTYEENVRDEWMPAYSRIILGKEYYEVYGENDELLHSFVKEDIADSVDLLEGPYYMNEEDAANYQHFVLDDDFYQASLDELQNMEVEPDSFYDEEDVLVAHFDSFSFLYDHQLKMMVYTEYTWGRVNKKKEKVILYGLTVDSSGYAPLQEITSEWFKSVNGCCVKKMTVILREEYQREVHEDYLDFVNPFTVPEGPFAIEQNRQKEPEYTVSSIPGSSSFMIQSPEHKGEVIQVALYDLAGKLILRQSITEGTPVKFPAVRAGLYLVEVFDQDGTSKLVRQVIKPDSGNTF